MNQSKDRKSSYKGSSDHLKKKFNVKKIVNLRMQIFIGILVVLASILIFRMYNIQIVNASHYNALYAKLQTPDDKYNTKRGSMTDRNGIELVSSKGINNIVYRPVKGLKDVDRWATAQNFAATFDSEYTLSDTEKKDAWLYINKQKKEVQVKIFTPEEEADIKKKNLKVSELIKLERAKVTEEMIAELSEEEMEAFKVYLLMGIKEANNTAVIQANASVEDISYLAEHQDQFIGFSSQTTEEREHNQDIGLQTIYGKVGLPQREKAQYYQALGYLGTDTVGISGLEYQYESLLNGVKSVYSAGSNGSEPQLISEGRPGFDLKLSIDAQLQAQLEEEIVKVLESQRHLPQRRYSKEMHAVISDPNNGDILAMASMFRAEDGTYYNDPQSALLKSSPVGSVVKPITVYMGINEGAITPSTVFVDKEMYIQGTPVRRSYMNLGSLDAVQALQVSSNIYMFYTTIALANSQYIPHGPLRIDDVQGLMRMMRNYYSEFGLGVKTGIDYPNEEVGYKGAVTNPGLALEFSIGQYDNYTPIQLSQFVNTLANGGYRVKPRLVLSAGDKATGRTVYENSVEILNEIENKDTLEYSREGMRRCSFYGNCNGFRPGVVTSAGKTGTAQLHAEGMPMFNHNFIAFAPYEKPEITVACVQPNAYPDDGQPGLVNQCGVLSEIIIENYFK